MSAFIVIILVLVVAAAIGYAMWMRRVKSKTAGNGDGADSNGTSDSTSGSTSGLVGPTSSNAETGTNGGNSGSTSGLVDPASSNADTGSNGSTSGSTGGLVGPVSSNLDPETRSCPRCPTEDCPPGAGNGFVPSDFYAQRATNAGLDPDKLSICNGIWHYDGKFTCVRGITSTDRCQHATGVCVTDLNVDGLPPGTTCGTAGSNGSIECQFAAIKMALDDGLGAIQCPLLVS